MQPPSSRSPLSAFLWSYRSQPEPPFAGPPPQLVRVSLPTGRVWVTWVLLAINIVMFVLTNIVSWLPGCRELGPLSFNCALFLLGWKDNAFIVQGEYWRLLTAIFLHGSLIHLGLNMLALYVLGPQAERVYHSGRFLLLYLIAGLAGSVASYAFTPSPSVGASGAIFGIFGALAVFYYTTRDILGEAGREQLRSMGVLVAINIAFGIFAGGAIDNFAHIGGLFGGGLSGFMLIPRFVLIRDWYYPRIERETGKYGLIGAFGLLLLIGMLAILINPPVR